MFLNASEPKDHKKRVWGGILVVSLDFELQYGVERYDEDTINAYRENLSGARDAVIKMLEMFKKHCIHATWAVVGMLLAEDKDELERYQPQLLPSYDKSDISTYEKFDRIGRNENDDPLHYAFELVWKIKKTEGQEIATHSFSHYYCMESGQTIPQFKADVESAKNITKDKLGIVPSSIVFPKNQVKKEYLDACKKLGITSYRGRNMAYDTSVVSRVKHFRDTYFGAVVNPQLLVSAQNEGGIVNVPETYFVPGYTSRRKILEALRIGAVKRSIRKAARQGKIIHLWWHPHNFGKDIKRNMVILADILNTYDDCRIKYDMRSLSMKEVADEVMR